MTAAGSARKGAMKVNPELAAPDQAPLIPALRSVAPEDRADDRADAFSINDVMYQISTRPPVNKALRYLHIARTQGTEAAIDYMLGVLLGEEGYEALMAFDDLTEEQLEQVITIASKIMTGAVESPKGPQKRG